MSSRRNFLKFLGIAPVVAMTTKTEAKPAELTLEQAVAEFEKGRLVKLGLPGACCQTGATYLAITHAGLKEEGKSFMGYDSTRAEAVKSWLASALKYANSRTGTLYWRTKPELDCRVTSDGREDWMVYSRFVVSDAYEVFNTVDDLYHTKKVQPHYHMGFGADPHRNMFED